MAKEFFFASIELIILIFAVYACAGGWIVFLGASVFIIYNRRGRLRFNGHFKKTTKA